MRRGYVRNVAASWARYLLDRLEAWAGENVADAFTELAEDPHPSAPVVWQRTEPEQRRAA